MFVVAGFHVAAQLVGGLEQFSLEVEVSAVAVFCGRSMGHRGVRFLFKGLNQAFKMGILPIIRGF